MILPDQLKQALAGVRSAGIITGAGISAESGIPTYRGVGGVYADEAAGNQLMDDLSGDTLRCDPDRTWRAIADLARRSTGAQPNAAHRALARLEAGLERCVLLTQNVDGLHGQAGSRNVIEIHGNLARALCTACETETPPPDWHALDAAPRCPDCQAVLRPDAVLFDEMLPARKLARIQADMIHAHLDLILVVGTTAQFPYIAAPVFLSQEALRVEVNPEPSEVTSVVDHHLAGLAGNIVPALVDAILSPA
jgi:NAD-dependent deacetylase